MKKTILFSLFLLFITSCTSYKCIEENFTNSQDIHKNICNINEKIWKYLEIQNSDNFAKNLFEIVQENPKKWYDFIRNYPYNPELNLKNKIQLYFLVKKFYIDSDIVQKYAQTISEEIQKSSLTFERVMMWENLLVQNFDAASMEKDLNWNVQGNIWSISFDEIIFLQEIFLDDIELFDSINIVASREDLYETTKTDEKIKKEYTKLLQIILKKSQNQTTKDLDGRFLEKILKEE